MPRFIFVGLAAALLSSAPGTAQVVHNADTFIQLSDVDLVLDDTSSGGPEFHLNLDETCNNCFAIEDQSTGNEPFIIEQGVRRASLYLDSSGEIGLGTSTPSQELHMVFNSPSIRFETPSLTWDLNANSNGFRVEDLTNNVTAFWVEPPEGYIGMGTGSPQAPLHMRRFDGAAKILVEETGPQASRTLLELKNNGNPELVLTNDATGASWNLSIADSGAFFIGATDTGGNADLSGRSEVRVASRLTARDYAQVSSRESKQNIEPVDGAKILDRLTHLELSEWSFQGEQTRHLGPMAEDFRAVFGLGDEAGQIVLGDALGVALAAVQGLRSELAVRETEIDEIRAQIEELRRLVAQSSATPSAAEKQVSEIEDGDRRTIDR